MVHFIWCLTAALFLLTSGKGLHAKNGYEYRNHRTKSSLNILVLGDSGTGKQEQYDVANSMHSVCQKLGCDFAVGLGDNIYGIGITHQGDPKLQTHFEKPYEKFGRFDFWMTLGNHDLILPTSLQAQVGYTWKSPRWRMPGAHYAIPGLPDWLHMYSINSEVLNWERSSLEAMEQYLCSKKGWKVLFGHHPLYSSGVHGDAKRMQRAQPIIKKCGINLVLAGHDHHQEHLTGHGFEMIIQGAAAKLRTVEINDLPSTLRVQNFAAAKLGFAILTVDEKNLKMKFYNTKGEILYHTERSLNQVGKFIPFAVPTGQNLRFVSSNRNTCLHASGSTRAGKGHEVYHNRCSNSSSKQWKLNPSTSKPGTFKIVNKKHGTCLHAATHTRALNGKLNIYHKQCTRSRSNYFWLKQIGPDNFQLISYKTGKCLHTSSSLWSGNGKQVYQHDCDGNEKKLFSTKKLNEEFRASKVKVQAHL